MCIYIYIYIYIYSNNKCMCVFLISPVPIAEPLTSELIDTPVFHNLAPRPIKYRVSVPIPTRDQLPGCLNTSNPQTLTLQLVKLLQRANGFNVVVCFLMFLIQNKRFSELSDVCKLVPSLPCSRTLVVYEWATGADPPGLWSSPSARSSLEHRSSCSRTRPSNHAPLQPCKTLHA